MFRFLSKYWDGGYSFWTPYLAYFIFRFAHFLVEVPTLRMIEHAACNKVVHPDGYVSRDDAGITNGNGGECNAASVQALISLVTGWKLSLDALAGLLAIMYFERTTDKLGYRLVLTICCLGYMLALLWVTMTCYFYEVFPVVLTLVSSVFLLLGGGQLVFAAMAVALVAELVDSRSRTRYLLLLAAMPHAAKLVSPPIATILMAHNIFLPSLISCLAILTCIILVQFSRTPKHQSNTVNDTYSSEGESLLGENLDGDPAEASSTAFSSHHDNQMEAEDDVASIRYLPYSQAEGPALSTWVNRVRYVLPKLAFFTSQGMVLPFCYIAFFLKSNAMASETFGPQYLSERFSWPLRNTTIIRFALSLGAVIATGVIGPAVSSLLDRRGVPTLRVNLSIIRVSLLALTAFFVTAWCAEASEVFILSMFGAGLCEGLEPALLSLLSVSTTSEQMAQPVGIAYMFSLLGDMTGGLLMSSLMSIGRTATSPSNGYSFLGSAVIFGIMAVYGLVIRV
ncbi:major facilitator superfamily domain-containing protein [Nemania abortiva]|nr:major facilitator superfamily domain-containing protein [Nemania abortiva]